MPKLIAHEREALTRWGAKIVPRTDLRADLVALLPVEGYDCLFCLFCQPPFRTLLPILRHNFENGAEFQIVVLICDQTRDKVASHLYRYLPTDLWNRVIVIVSAGIYSTLRYVEGEFETRE